MNRFLLLTVVVFWMVVSFASAGSVGNPMPDVPHDTIIIHAQKPPESGVAKGCAEEGGGHALFLRTDPVTGEVDSDTHIFITMTDWIRVDNDDDGQFDEDPPGDVDGDLDPDDDVDGDIDEDGPEPGKETYAIDCDSWDDDTVRLQIRDTEPAKGEISLQKWFLRLIGKPQETFAFTTFANQVESCEFVLDGDGNQINRPDHRGPCRGVHMERAGRLG